jgi:hypothetical protein
VPDIERRQVPLITDERTMLEAWLDFHRATLLIKCSGLDNSQLRLRSASPSSLSLLGLVRHMTDVERSWFRRRIAGETGADVARLYRTEQNPDGDFDDVDTADVSRCVCESVLHCRGDRAAGSMGLIREQTEAVLP